MQPVQPEADYKERYFAILAEKEKLDEELNEYRNLERVFETNQRMCDRTFAECERFMQVVLLHYKKLKQSEANEKERILRWNYERENLEKELKSLLEQIKEKDHTIQLANSDNERLMEKLAEGERKYHLMIEERRTRSSELEQELALTKDKLQTVTNLLELTEQEKLEKIQELDNIRAKTITVIQQKTETFNQYMDQVALLHDDINTVIRRYNSQTVQIISPVRSSYNEQLENMKKSINQLDELTAATVVRRITKEDMDELNRENEQLREELEELTHRLINEGAKSNTLIMRCRYNDLRKKELDQIVNDYSKKEVILRNNINLLYKNKVDLTAENSQYQEQVKMLQNEINRLQEDRDKTTRAMAQLESEPHTLVHDIIMLKEKLDEKESQAVTRNKEIMLLVKIIDKAKKTLQANELLIQNSNSLITLLKELEDPHQTNWECLDFN